MRDADLVLRNGNLLTFDRSSRIASSVAIANGRICMVGSDDEIARNVPPDARTIDLRGRSAMPGFFDGHPHMDREGLESLRGHCDLRAALHRCDRRRRGRCRQEGGAR